MLPLVIASNKMRAGQLHGEFKGFSRKIVVKQYKEHISEFNRKMGKYL